MIKKLRRRMSLLVIGVLIIVSAGIVLAIYEVNNRNIVRQAEAALDALAQRPPLPDETDGGETIPPPSEPPDAEKAGENTLPPDGMTTGEGRDRGDPGRFGPGRDGGDPRQNPGFRGEDRGRALSIEEVASLSNYYTMTLDGDGTILSWESDREKLYNQEELQKFADRVCAGEKSSGRIDTQFYRLVEQGDSRKIIVLDARLELMAGQRVLWATAAVAGIACLVLSGGAWLLIRRMVKPVEDAFVRQQQFVWDASHELKTPLAVISANADVLEGEIGENEYLGYIRSEVQRTDSLVKNLLTLARMDRGTVNRDMTEIDLSEALLGVLLPFESTVFEAGKELDTEGVQEHIRVTGNEPMLQQLAVILLSNALKYSNEHGKITVSLTRKGRGAELRVQNTGDGIAPADRERIFDRFYRTDSSRNSETGGEGLGLAIAKSIVEIHHGKIRAESVIGESATFIVEIP